MINKIILLFGGSSDEHDISITSTKYVYSILSELNYNLDCIYFDIENKMYIAHFDNSTGLEINKIKEIGLTALIQMSKEAIVFPINYGKCAEDGKIYALLELYNIKTLGGPYNAYQLTFDKLFTKYFLTANNYGTPEYKFYTTDIQTKELIIEDITNSFSKPVIIKPRANGSSIGINLVKEIKSQHIAKAIENTLKYENDLICEEFISNFREFQVSVIQYKDNYEVSKVVELTSNSEFLDYNEKFSKNNSLKYHFENSDFPFISEMKQQSIEIMKLLKIRHFVRMDFIVDTQNNRLLINEISPMFGLIEQGAFWKLWRATGYTDHEVFKNVLSDFE